MMFMLPIILIAICENKVDIMLVMDSSSSIITPNFNKMKSFLVTYVSRFTVGKDAAWFGAVRFGDGADVVIGLGDDMDVESLQQSIDQIVHLQENTNTAAGIRSATQELNLNGRLNVPQVMLVLTDGRSNNAIDTATAADEARADGIELFSIGIGGNADETELKAIASDPDEGHVYDIEDFEEDSFNEILSGLVEETCNGEVSDNDKIIHKSKYPV